MDVQKVHGVEKVLLDCEPVVDVHEFAGDQPAGEAPICHPLVAQSEKVAVQAGESAQFKAASRSGELAQPMLVTVGDVVVAHVWRVADEQIGCPRGRRCRSAGEVGLSDVEARRLPQRRSRHRVVRIDLVADGGVDAFLGAHLEKRRIEGSRADGGIEEAHFGVGAQLTLCVAEDVPGERRWGRELPHAVSFGLGLCGVEIPLKRQPSRLDGGFLAHVHLQAESGKVVDAMFPRPVDALSRLIAEVAAVEIAAEEEVEANIVAVGVAQLSHLGRLLLAPLVDIREVARGLRLQEQGEVARFGSLGHDHGVDGNVDLSIRAFLIDRHDQPKGVGAGGACGRTWFRLARACIPWRRATPPIAVSWRFSCALRMMGLATAPHSRSATMVAAR